MRLSSLLVLFATTGCSWVTMTRPPPPPVEPRPPATCTTSRLAPALDTVGAVLLAVPGAITTGYGIATPVCSHNCFLEPESGGSKAAIIGVGVLLLGLAAVETASAVTGYGWASGCEALKESQLACLSGVEASCAALRAPPPREGGKAPGEVCKDDGECRVTDMCFQGRCQPRPP